MGDLLCLLDCGCCCFATTGALDAWPALRLWDEAYLVAKAGTMQVSSERNNSTSTGGRQQAHGQQWPAAQHDDVSVLPHVALSGDS